MVLVLIALLKSSIVTPIPKVSPPALIEQNLRPISLTCTLAKVMEGFTCSRLLPHLEGKIDPCQFSRKGHSTKDALIYMLQAIYEAVDSGGVSARIFFADFSKGFDLIDDSILMQELADLEVHTVLLSWIAALRNGACRSASPAKSRIPWLFARSQRKATHVASFDSRLKC